MTQSEPNSAGGSAMRRTPSLQACLAYLFAPARAALLGSLALLAAVKLAAMAAPIFYKYAVDALAAPGLPSERMLMLGGLGLIGAYVAARWMRTGFARMREMVCARALRLAADRFAQELIFHIFRLPAHFHAAGKANLSALVRSTLYLPEHLHAAGKADMLARRTQRAIVGAEFLLRSILFHCAPFILELALVAGALWLMLDWRYALLVAGAAAFYAAAAVGLAAAQSESARRQEGEQEAQRQFADRLANLSVVQQFGAERREAEHYQRARNPAGDMAARASDVAIGLGQATLWHVGFLLCLVWTVRDIVQGGGRSLGDLVMVHAYWMQLMLPLEGCKLDVRRLRRAHTEMGDMLARLQAPPAPADTPRAPALVVRAGELVFDRVTFGYDAAHPVVRNISFAVARGQTVALVGAARAGKSTIGRLLFRSCDVQEGAIRIDGQDVRSVSRASLRAAIGIISRKTFLFHDSVYNNIAYARPAASEAEVMAAAKAACLHETIVAMPNGYQTILDNSVVLRMHDDRRIAIARLLLQNPPILLLDEAELSDDAAPQERDTQIALRALCAGRTTVTATHNLSAVAHADKIIVLSKGGGIIEQGPHKTLLALDGYYASGWRVHMQWREAERARWRSRPRWRGLG